MSIKDLTITDQNVQSTYVQSQPDRLTGTAQQNKAVFDALPQLIRQRFNALLEAMAGAGAAGEIPVEPIEGVTAENVQQALEAIQQNLTAYINKIKAATGAAEVGVSQISGMQAQNVQKALEELRTAIDNIVSGIIPGGSITADMLADDVTGDRIPTSELDSTPISKSISQKISMPIEIPQNADLNAYRIPGMYFCPSDAAAATVKNCPIPYGFALLVEKNLENHVFQTITFWRNAAAYSNVTKYMRRTYPSPSKWELIATATSPESLNIPLEDGFTGALRAERNQFGEVLLTGAVKATSLGGNDLIATLPAGYLPKASDERFIAVSNRNADNNSFATTGQISSDGDVKLWQYIPDHYTALSYLVINHKYQART